VGVWRRELLRRAIKKKDNLYGKNLEWFMALVFDYGLNYVRTDACEDYALVRWFCQKMYENNVVVELTLTDGDTNLGNPRRVVPSVKDLPNVIFEPVNEFFKNKNDLNTAWWWCNHLRELGLYTSAGAYGIGGQSLSEKFDPANSTNHIITVHREWYKASIQRYNSSNKPILRNEFFGVSAQEMARIMRESFEAGASGVCYYGLRSKTLFPDLQKQDPDLWSLYFTTASKIYKTIHS